MEQRTAERRPRASETVPFRFSPRPNRAHEIRWHSWGDEPFRLAREQDKLILLAVSAVWCHWCHVMDETTYSDQRVIDLVNRDFIPVRVDANLRPEVDQRYNMGGWPTLAILTPGGEILTGETYVPPQLARALLQRTRNYYYAHKTEVCSRILELQKQREAKTTVEARPGALSESIVHNLLVSLTDAYDPVYGGFGEAPKFLFPDALEFLLQQYRYTGQAELLQMVSKTLEAMQEGEIFDREEGGFFRYATMRDWGAPHYEKMLEDNARMLRVYLHAYQLTGEPGYRDTAWRIIGYLDRTLYDPKRGAFRGSQDADEEYYRLRAEQRVKVRAPYVDPVIYTDSNAALASAYVQASYILDEPGCLHVARRVIEFLWQRSHEPETGMAHYYYRSAKVRGLLRDQVWMASALLDAYEALSEPMYLERAQQLAKLLETQYADSEGGGFFDIAASVSALGALRHRQKPIQENAAAADIFLRLSLLTANEAYRTVATRALKAFSNTYSRHGSLAASYAAAVQRVLRPPLHIVVVGEPDQPTVEELRSTGLRQLVPVRTVQVLSPRRDSRRLHQLGYPSRPAPVAYVCGDHRCAPPVDSPSSLAQAIEDWIGPVGGRFRPLT